MTKKSDAPAIRFKGFSDAWEQRKLSELTSMHARIGWQNLRTSEFLDSGNYMLITGTDFNDGAINFSTCHYVERERYEQDRNIQIHNGSILITKDGTLGKVAYVQGLSMPATLNAGVFNVQIKDANNVDEKYLFQYLKAPFLMDYVDKKATGGTIKHLNQSILVDFPVILPQRSEQTLIGAFFLQLDNLITLHQRECISFTVRAGGLILTANKKRTTSSWEQRKFSELVQIERGGSPRPIDDFITDAPNGLNWIKIGDAPTQGNYITKTAEKIRPEGLSKTREVHPGDLILSNSMSFGKPYIMGIDGCIHDGWLLIRNTYGVFDLTFLCHLLGTPQMLSQYRSLAAGSTVNNLNKELVGNTVVTIPSITEQRVLGDYLEQLDNLITLHQRQPFLHSTPEISLTVQLIHPFYTSSWEQRKAKELFVSTADKGYPELPVLSATQDRGMIRRDENSINIFHDKKNEAGYKRVLPGQFVIHLRSFQGGFAHSAIEGITSPAYTVFGFSEPEKHDSEYWKYVFTSKSFIQRLETVTYGIRDGRSISYEEFLTLGFVYPSKAEQTAIARYLDKLSDLITLHQRKGKAAVTGCSNDANNSKGVYCKARDFGYKCYKKVKSQQIRCLIAVFIFFV